MMDNIPSSLTITDVSVKSRSIQISENVKIQLVTKT